MAEYIEVEDMDDAILVLPIEDGAMVELIELQDIELEVIEIPRGDV